MSWILVLAVAPLVVGLVLVCLREPMRVALPIYAALIPFGGAISLGSSPYGSASSLIGLMLAAGLLVQLVVGRRAASRLPATVPVWVVFLGVAMATTLWTTNSGVTLNGLAVLGSLVLVFVLASLSEVDRTVVRRTENGLLVGGVAAVGYGFLQLVFLGGFLSDQTGAAATPADAGRFGNGMLGPNIEAVTLLVPMAIAVNRAFTEGGPRSRGVHGATAALMLTGVLMTGSRTGTLAAGVVLVALLAAGPRQARRGLATVLVVGAAVSALVWVYHPWGLTERTFASATSSSGRIDIWEVGLAACRHYCVLGAGWGTFPEVYAQTQALVPGARVLTGAQGSYQPHNQWLLAVVETGVLGLLLFSAGLLVTLREALNVPPEHRGAAVGSLLGLGFALIFLSSMEFKIFWIVLLLITLYGNVAHAESQERHVARRRLATDARW